MLGEWCNPNCIYVGALVYVVAPVVALVGVTFVVGLVNARDRERE